MTSSFPFYRQITTQLLALTKKNLILFSRRPIITLLYLISPTILILTLGWLSDAIAAGQVNNNSAMQADFLSCHQCRYSVYGDPTFESDCQILSFATPSRASAAEIEIGDDIIKNFAIMQSLDPEEFTAFKDPTSMAKAFYSDTTAYTFAVNFLNLTDETTSYEVWYNTTNIFLAGESELDTGEFESNDP